MLGSSQWAERGLGVDPTRHVVSKPIIVSEDHPMEYRGQLGTGIEMRDQTNGHIGGIDADPAQRVFAPPITVWEDRAKACQGRPRLCRSRAKDQQVLYG